MNDSSFAGTSGFTWFTGVIEDIDDPTKTGQVRVRIIGWHDSDKAKLPTDKLPWAQVVLPTTGSKSSHTLTLNDWVLGFFQDGNLGNIPVVTGMYASLLAPVTQDIDQRGFGVYNTAQDLPRPPASYIVDKYGHPVLPLTSRTAVGSIVAWSNENLIAACDISEDVKALAAAIRLKFGVIVEAIKKALEELAKILGFTPSGAIRSLTEELKSILRTIKKWARLIEEAVQWKEIILDYARKLRAIIDYIMGLPAKLLALLKKCLEKLSDALVDGFKSLFSLPGAGDSANELGELINTASEIGKVASNAASDVVELSQFPAELIDTLSTPASQEDIDFVAANIELYIASNPAQTANGISELYNTLDMNSSSNTP